MGYLHIENLYKNREILMFRECYALEKIHGTSAHIAWNGGHLGFFSGGENYERFLLLFNHDSLKEGFESIAAEKIIIYGEAYGGKQQGMRKTYGDQLKFIVFDVKIGDYWLDVPKAESIAKSLGLEFVDYVRVNTEIETLNYWRDMPSTQSVRNGILEERPREGVVLRPIIELRKNNGERIISKHKAEEFQETKTTRILNQEQLTVLSAADDVASEWVTPMRLTHVLQKFHGETGMEATPKVIAAMLEDIEREGAGEIVFSKEVKKQISRKAAELYKKRITTMI